ncbi:hypothetical protein [Clostridium puniceum]|uniref:hypothetical protein n=1 Tax=Clostridium puniceum TaxID=29367 RepID=UPI0013016F7C|nr:hypothetical protein [Clostridium puniceum]
MRNNNFIETIVSNYKRNSTVSVKYYNISLEEIFNYVEEEGWLKERICTKTVTKL